MKAIHNSHPLANTSVLLALLCFSLLSLGIYSLRLGGAIADIPTLTPSDRLLPLSPSPRVSVIVPAYNEAVNIYDCVTSVLKSTNLSSTFLEVWVVDDQSTDETLAILQTLSQQFQDPRLNIIVGEPRPCDRPWVGKNWACAQAAKQAQGEFLLFLDADVRLLPGAIETVLLTAQGAGVDLLNGIPAVVCGSLVEWLVQPLIFINMLISFNHPTIKDPSSTTAFAAGPLILFRRTAYDNVGGHWAVSDQVAEDVALARAVKRQGLKLQYFLGANLATLRMYTSVPALWEGWTKVLYVGSNRSVGLMLLLMLAMLTNYVLPWVGLAIALSNAMTEESRLAYGAIALALIAIGMQFYLRILLQRGLNCSLKYWWLQGVGGLMVGAIALVSVIKTETGWGWTWRGRSIKTTSS